MNKALKYLFFSNAFFVIAASLLTPIYALFIEDIGGGLEIAGILFAVQYISVTLVSLLVLKLRDHSSPGVGLLAIGWIIRAVAWATLAMFPTLTVMLVTQLFIGAGEALSTPAFLALVSDHLDKDRHIRDWGIWSLVGNPMVALASAASGFIVVGFGFRALFAIMALGAFLAAAILFYYRKHFR